MEVAVVTEGLKARVLGACQRTNGVWALFDQALISGSNFIVMVLAARGMSPTAFGAFTLVYSVLLFANAVQTSLITQPHNVLAAGKPRSRYISYTTGVAIGQLFTTVGAALACVLAAGLAQHFQWAASTLLWGLAAALFAWQVQEFVRRVLYTESRLRTAFFCDVVAYGGQAVLIFSLEWRDELTGTRALYAIAWACSLAALPGIWQIRKSLRRPDWGSLRENWRFGKWLAGAEILNWCSSIYLYQYITAILLNAAASGLLKASQTVFGPSRVLVYFLSTVLPIWFARDLAQGGTDAMCARLKRISSLVLPITGVYCLLVCIFAGPILRVLYGNAYTQGTTTLMLYSVVTFTSCQQLLLASAITAMRRTHLVFLGNVYGGLISVLASWMLVYSLGVIGAVIGMLITTITVTLFFWHAYQRERAMPRESQKLVLQSSVA